MYKRKRQAIGWGVAFLLLYLSLWGLYENASFVLRHFGLSLGFLDFLALFLILLLLGPTGKDAFIVKDLFVLNAFFYLLFLSLGFGSQFSMIRVKVVANLIVGIYLWSLDRKGDMDESAQA